MKKRMSFVIVVITVLIFVAPAHAFDRDRHIIQAPDALGDVLIFPHFVALDGGWENKFVVVNTDDARSAVAKVVIRSGAHAQSLKYFLIYLSPADVWSGRIYNDAALGPVIESGDDSVVASSGPIFATEEAPMKVALEDNPCDENHLGYVTVVMTWSSDEMWDCMGEGEVDLGPDTDSKVDKECIYNSYHNVTGVGDPGKNWLETNDGPWNCLTGSYEISLANVVGFGDNATVLRDYDLFIFTMQGVISTVGTGADNNLCEIEAALSKKSLNLYFEGGFSAISVNWVTFPTKLSVINPESCDYATPYVRGPFSAWQSSPYAVTYSPKYWDMVENTPGGVDTYFSPYSVPPDDAYQDAVNFRFMTPPFIAAAYWEGWIRHSFNASTDCAPVGDSSDTLSYTGAPAIALTWIIKDFGRIIPAAYVKGEVRYAEGRSEATPVPYYQYQNTAYDEAPYGEFEEYYP
ncbi:MAG: hypothetical protein GY859_21425 [Desulfobacterales bacterium]|nr:hypothetical protein [Desulfobacterales bacterium]